MNCRLFELLIKRFEEGKGLRNGKESNNPIDQEGWLRMAFWHSLTVNGMWLLSEPTESLWQKCSLHSRRSWKVTLLPTPLQTRRPMAAPGTVMPLTQRAYQQRDNGHSCPPRTHSENRLHACGCFLFVCEQNLNIISSFFPLYAYVSLFVLHTVAKKKSLAGWLTIELLPSSTHSMFVCMHVHTRTCVFMHVCRSLPSGPSS